MRVGSHPVAFGQFIGKTTPIKIEEANTNSGFIDKIALQNFSKIWENKGISLCLYCEHDYDDAIKVFDKAIEIDRKNSDAWYNKGLALFELNKTDEAIKAYDKAIEINPQNEFAWISKGVIFGDLNKADEARKAYDKAIEINPKNSDAWYKKGRLLNNLNE